MYDLLFTQIKCINDPSHRLLRNPPIAPRAGGFRFAQFEQFGFPFGPQRIDAQ